MARGSSPQSPGQRMFMIFLAYCSFHCFVMYLSCRPSLRDIFHIYGTYSLFVLKVPLNNNPLTNSHHLTIQAQPQILLLLSWRVHAMLEFFNCENTECTGHEWCINQFCIFDASFMCVVFVESLFFYKNHAVVTVWRNTTISVIAVLSILFSVSLCPQHWLDCCAASTWVCPSVGSSTQVPCGLRVQRIGPLLHFLARCCKWQLKQAVKSLLC